MRNRPRLLALAAALILVVPAFGADLEMKEPKAEWRFDGSDPRLLKSKFGSYGYHPTQSIRPDKDGIRYWLPAREKIPQTGLYSLFSLAGDCEFIVAYEFLKLDTPKTGYGTGIGIAFDLGEGGESGWATMQRVDKPKKGSGYVVQTNMPDTKEVYKFQPAPPTSGRIGLRRVGKQLLFLASDTLTGDMNVLGDPEPFSDITIRKVRVFADPGGSPTILDARVRSIEARALEMAGGIPIYRPDKPNRWWLWLIPPVVISCLLALILIKARSRTPTSAKVSVQKKVTSPKGR